MAHICQHLAALARTAPHRQLTSCEGREQTAAEFVARVAALSAALVLDLGLRAGDRVALAAVNTDRHFEALLAILAAGGLVAPLNWRWSLQVRAMLQISRSFKADEGHVWRWLIGAIMPSQA